MIQKLHLLTRTAVLAWLLAAAVLSLPLTAAQEAPTPQPGLLPGVRGQSRGYTTTPAELAVIAQKAAAGQQPYANAVRDVLNWADKGWDYSLDTHESCRNSQNPAWIHNERGVKRTFSRALAYGLTQDEKYAEEVKSILERIMTEVLTISTGAQQCRLNFGWGTPELVASADLIEDYWVNMTCTGPLSFNYDDVTIGEGNCKALFQNWLVKNPYYVVSYAAEDNQSNWGAAATNTLAYIADYVWDRTDIRLAHRAPTALDTRAETSYTPAEAYARANRLALDRMNGYRVDYHSSRSCDLFGGPEQLNNAPPVKSQITPEGIIPEDARRAEACNITRYDGDYQNYPQLHLGNNIEQCELMLRRGDSSCYDNIDMSDVPDFTWVDGKGRSHTTHLYPGRGSIERAFNAIIVDSGTEWRHDSALEVAYRYYSVHHRFPGVEEWPKEFNRPSECAQDICFGTLTHGFSDWETPEPPPMVAPPGEPREIIP